MPSTLESEIVMAEHHTFWISRASTTENDGCQIINGVGCVIAPQARSSKRMGARTASKRAVSLCASRLMDFPHVFNPDGSEDWLGARPWLFLRRHTIG